MWMCGYMVWRDVGVNDVRVWGVESVRVWIVCGCGCVDVGGVRVYLTVNDVWRTSYGCVDLYARVYMCRCFGC